MSQLWRRKSLEDCERDIAERSGLKRTLNKWHLTALGVGATIRAGIFATTGTAIVGDSARPGAGPTIVLSFLLTAIACGFAALCYAEFASMVPVVTTRLGDGPLRRRPDYRGASRRGARSVSARGVPVKALASALLFLLLAGCAREARWCDGLPREQYKGLERVTVADDWFEVYRVGDGVLAIYEPYQFQEVISYLILGRDSALLFDTGMGISKISDIVRELTPLPVTVINSHTHYDHVGGNAEFDRILAIDGDFTRSHAAGQGHEVVKGDVAADAFCRTPPAGFDTATYAVRPFTITQTIGDGYRIELGGRTLQVLQVPGHTPDAVAVLDSAAGYLWTGDTFYEAPIWLWFPETDWPAYERSVERLAALVPELKRLFGAHNTPVAEPAQLARLKEAVAAIKARKARWEERPDGLVEYPFSGFSVLTRKSYFVAPE